jgi:predicted nucleic acid-binding protein
MIVSGSTNRVVVDASVIVKWFLPEADHDRARALLDELQDPVIDAYAPELALAEVGNALWKRTQTATPLLTIDQALRATAALEHLPLIWHRHQPLLARAIALAIQARVTAYDALYAALALQLDALFITADARLITRLDAADWGGRAMELSARASRRR